MLSQLNLPPAAHTKPLRVFAFYTDFAAGVQAKLVADEMILRAENTAASSLEIWKLDSIPPIGPLKHLIIDEAREADVWIIATSSPDEWDALIMPWLNCLPARGGETKTSGVLVGLFGDSCATAESRHFAELFKLLEFSAQRRGWRFVWRKIPSPTEKISNRPEEAVS